MCKGFEVGCAGGSTARRPAQGKTASCTTCPPHCRARQQTHSPSPSAGGALLWSALFFDTQQTAKARKQGYWVKGG